MPFYNSALFIFLSCRVTKTHAAYEQKTLSSLKKKKDGVLV